MTFYEFVKIMTMQLQCPQFGCELCYMTHSSYVSHLSGEDLPLAKLLGKHFI